MTIDDILLEQARTRGEAVAILDVRDGVNRRLTFAGLTHEVARAARFFADAGLQRGDGVLVFVPMSAELYVALLALFRLGAVALFLDPSAGPEHIEQCCTRWPPKALLATRKGHWLRLVSAALRQIPVKFSIGGWVPGARRFVTGVGEGKDGAVAPEARVPVGKDDPALVTFTSGSTGQPKAAVRTHGFLVAQHRALAPNIELVEGEIDLATLPVFTLANLASGVTTVIPDLDLRRPGAVDGARICEQVQRHGITRTTASPAFLERMAEHALRSGQTLRGLTKLHTGGAPVFPRLLDMLARCAPLAQVVAVYGSTEAEPIGHLDVRDLSAGDRAAMRFGRGLLAGVPVPEIDLRILRDRWGQPRGRLTARELERETLTADEPGEIVVAGAHVLPGYLGGIGDEETKFSVDGKVWHRTGDAGLLDERGRLWLLGRCAARITDTRGKLYPFPVECVAMTFPEVRRAAVLGHEGRRLLIVEAAFTSEVLATQLRQASEWARIDEVRFVAALPLDKRHNAKIDYTALRRAVGAQ